MSAGWLAFLILWAIGMIPVYAHLSEFENGLWPRWVTWILVPLWPLAYPTMFAWMVFWLVIDYYAETIYRLKQKFHRPKPISERPLM